MTLVRKQTQTTDRIDSFYAWKQQLLEQIQAYCEWLSNNGAASEDVISRLARSCLDLQEDELTIALVGEFSRGKTELLNALLFADQQQRLLPSRAGRTTMCPTELFYDRQKKCSYLRLLPIESRRLNLTIAEMKSKGDLWEEYAIDITKPDEMAKVLHHVSDVLSVTKADALALGFDEAMQEEDPDNSYNVLIPRWRHAELSLKHPLLQQGLRILDTPGLNALGSEPELTVSMIPKAQAIVFLLSADAGVTASDMAIWSEHIAPNGFDKEKICYALLNKIDVLWDDLQGEMHTASSIEAVRKDTSRRLGIPREFVLPVSAKKALMAKVNKDTALLQKSGLGNFEGLLLDQLVETREKLLYDSAIADISSLVESSEKVIAHRILREKNALEQHENSIDDKDSLSSLAEQTQSAHSVFYKKLVALRSSRRLMLSQKQILQDLVQLKKFENLVDEIRRDMQDAWNTRRLVKAMQRLFDEMDQVLDGLMVEVRVAEKMVTSMYARFKNDHDVNHLHPTNFSIKKQRTKLNEIKANFDSYRRNPKLLMTEQSLVIRHFRNAFIRDVRLVYEELGALTACWADDALLPLLQYTVEQKNGLQAQLQDLQRLAQDQKSKREECDQMRQSIEQLQHQQALTKQITEQLSAHP